VVIVVVSGVIYIVYRYRLRQALAVERMRTRIATDLHDEVSSTLSGISILSDIISNQVSEPKLHSMSRHIGVNASKMMEKIDDIIWIVNPSNDRFDNLGLRIREFAIPLFESANIRFEFEFDENLNRLQIPMDIRRNLYLICKEAINNLVKYANCTETQVRFLYDGKGLSMMVRDNGTGFNPQMQTSRNGLRNMRNRAAAIQAEIQIFSQPGLGSTISLYLKTI
jgi:two-component system, NarL family, sensor histidine kinase UhpB